MINKTLLIGRLTKDPEVKKFQGGTAVASFTLAVDRNYKNKDGEREADFIPVVAWRKTAELLEKYTHRGDMLAVVGRIQTRSYETPDGYKRYVTEVVADEVQFVQTKEKSDIVVDEQPYAGFEEISDFDVPF